MLKHMCLVLAAALAAGLLSPPVTAGPVELVVAEFSDHYSRYDGLTGASLGNSQTTSLMKVGSGIALGPDGFLYVSSWSGNAVLRYDATTGQFIGALSNPSNVTYMDGLTLGPDGLLYIACNNTGVQRWNPATGGYAGLFASADQGSVPADCAFGPDGNLYVVYAMTSGSGKVIRFNGLTGAFMDVFASQGMSFATGMTFGPDGNLYVTNIPGNNVTRYDGTTGAYLGVFATVSSPEGIRFGPDGNLYVASHTNKGVLRYNGVTGAYIDQFVTVPDGNMPTKIEFVTVPEPGTLVALFLAFGGCVSVVRRVRP